MTHVDTYKMANRANKFTQLSRHDRVNYGKKCFEIFKFNEKHFYNKKYFPFFIMEKTLSEFCLWNDSAII